MTIGINPNPWKRQYTPEEWAAAKRLGYYVGEKEQRRGPLIYGGGQYEPRHARQMADDWAIVARAIEREWRWSEFQKSQNQLREEIAEILTTCCMKATPAGEAVTQIIEIIEDKVRGNQ